MISHNITRLDNYTFEVEWGHSGLIDLFKLSLDEISRGIHNSMGVLFYVSRTGSIIAYDDQEKQFIAYERIVKSVRKIDDLSFENLITKITNLRANGFKCSRISKNNLFHLKSESSSFSIQCINTSENLPSPLYNNLLTLPVSFSIITNYGTDIEF